MAEKLQPVICQMFTNYSVETMKNEKKKEKRFKLEYPYVQKNYE